MGYVRLVWVVMDSTHLDIKRARVKQSKLYIRAWAMVGLVFVGLCVFFSLSFPPSCPSHPTKTSTNWSFFSHNGLVGLTWFFYFSLQLLPNPTIYSISYFYQTLPYTNVNKILGPVFLPLVIFSLTPSTPSEVLLVWDSRPTSSKDQVPQWLNQLKLVFTIC